jgi:hypothetical protein
VTIVEHYSVEGSMVISLRNGFLAQGRLAPPTVERRQHLTGVVAVLKCTSNSLTASIEYATDVLSIDCSLSVHMLFYVIASEQ